MKKIIMLLLAICCVTFGQDEKLKVAVGMVGREPATALGAHRVISGELTKAISRSDKYVAVNRTDAILAQLNREHEYQRSGAVDDDQIKALGQQFGVQYLCLAEINEVRGGAFYIEVQLVDVVTAEVIKTASATSDLLNNAAMMIVAQIVARDLVGVVSEQASNRQREIEIEMVTVQGGTFTMGCTGPRRGCEKDELPARQVTVSDFQIGKYPVTQRQWKQVMGANNNPSHFKGDDLPVGRVSWYDVQDFIEKLNAMTGKQYRLPTEAEWEYAARGGTRNSGFTFAGSNDINDVAWYKDNSGNRANPVGRKLPNELGIHDMSGNVWEWVQDWKGRYRSAAETNPQGPQTGKNRVLRGGSFPYDASYSRVSYRGSSGPGNRGADVGFRLAISE